MSMNKDHGNATSYIIGFVLSLIFTIIPYYLVVNKVQAGNTLLLTILGIAVIQMFIQIFFFLHLGRGPKPFYNIVFFFATAGLIVIVVGASILIMQNLYKNMSPQEYVIKQSQEENISQIGGEETGACNEVKNNHIVTIGDGLAIPSSVQAQRCDSLTFVNQGEQDIEIVFGSQGEAMSYGGLFELSVSNSKPETITLNETGFVNYYELNNPLTTGSFSVTE